MLFFAPSFIQSVAWPLRSLLPTLIELPFRSQSRPRPPISTKQLFSIAQRLWTKCMEDTITEISRPGRMCIPQYSRPHRRPHSDRLLRLCPRLASPPTSSFLIHKQTTISSPSRANVRPPRHRNALGPLAILVRECELPPALPLRLPSPHHPIQCPSQNLKPQRPPVLSQIGRAHV